MGSATSQRSGRGLVVVATVLAGIGASAWLLARVMLNPAKTGGGPSSAQPAGLLPTGAVATLPDAVYTCAKCHALPPPSILPKSRWPSMIREMTARIATYNLAQPLTQQQVDEVTGYYVAAAPDALQELPMRYAPSPLSFQPMPVGPQPVPGPGVAPPLIGCIRIIDLDRNGKPDLLVCDIGANQVDLLMNQNGWQEFVLGKVAAPAHAEVADLGGKGRPDIVVASLGSIKPTDDPVGSVVVLSQGANGITARTILANAPRISDVRIADLSGDGRPDIAVAEFGMYKTGGVVWLEQSGEGEFIPHTLKQINGAQFVPVADLNGDNKPDIVAMIAQEHEEIIAFVNQGAGKFEERVIWQGPHPAYGCAGMQVVDLNNDGQPDIVFTNGDALDFDTLPKPYHGVQWLENKGDLRFEYHDIMRYYGAYSLSVADLDGDGDLDIVVTTMAQKWDDPGAESIIWLENDGQQHFTPHPLSTGPAYQVAVDVGDLNGDRRPDIVTGGLYVMQPVRVARITMFANGGPTH